MKPHEKLILLTNDDGIQSPGLRAAAEALSQIGWVTVVAPLNQWSGAGRSMHLNNGVIHVLSHQIGGDHWEVYAVEGTPAQSVQHGVLELVPRQPDLVVAGINYGENVGTGDNFGNSGRGDGGGGIRHPGDGDLAGDSEGVSHVLFNGHQLCNGGVLRQKICADDPQGQDAL